MVKTMSAKQYIKQLLGLPPGEKLSHIDLYKIAFDMPNRAQYLDRMACSMAAELDAKPENIVGVERNGVSAAAIAWEEPAAPHSGKIKDIQLSEGDGDRQLITIEFNNGWIEAVEFSNDFDRLQIAAALRFLAANIEASKGIDQ
jgi:hypothetical protein